MLSSLQVTPPLESSAHSGMTNTGRYYLMLVLYGKPKSANELYSAHWRIRHKNAQVWKQTVYALTRNHTPKAPLQKFIVKAIVYRSRLMDYDGAVSTLKPLLDGLKGIVIEDDGYAYTGPWHVTQEKCKRGDERVELSIEEPR